jgi:hypothetical protein
MFLPHTDAILGAVLPGTQWKQVTCAARLAVTHVNAGFEGIVPGLQGLVGNLTLLTDSMYDTGYSAPTALLSYRQMQADGGQAIIGAARSAVSGPLALQAKIDEIPLCSYWSTSAGLSDVLQYPYCARTAALVHIPRKSLPGHSIL